MPPRPPLPPTVLLALGLGGRALAGDDPPDENTTTEPSGEVPADEQSVKACLDIMACLSEVPIDIPRPPLGPGDDPMMHACLSVALPPFGPSPQRPTDATEGEGAGEDDGDDDTGEPPAEPCLKIAPEDPGPPVHPCLSPRPPPLPPPDEDDDDDDGGDDGGDGDDDEHRWWPPWRASADREEAIARLEREGVLPPEVAEKLKS